MSGSSSTQPTVLRRGFFSSSVREHDGGFHRLPMEQQQQPKPERDEGDSTAKVDDDDDDDEEKPEDVTCDWLGCGPDCCQVFARPSCLLLWLCLCSFTQGMLVNGFVNSVLTTLELRYDMQSSESGLIASSYDIGSVLCLVPLTYFGRRYRRSRLISIGILIMGVGSFIFSAPQFTAGMYKYESPVSPLCYGPGYSYPSYCTQQVLNSYKWVFWLGQFLHGVGASPFYTLAVAYLDDNLSVRQSGAFLGLYYMMSLIGPAMGYLLGGVFLEFYVDLGVTPTDLTSANTSLWVGAWWIGFLVSGTMSLLVVVPIFGFPTKFKGSAKLQRERHKEAHGDSGEKSARLQMGLKDFLPSLKVLLTNPTLVFLSLSGAVDALLVAGMSTFGPKVMQTLFYMTSSAATLTIGLVSVPSAAIGLLAGGMVIRFTDLNVQQLLRLCSAVSGGGILVCFAFFIRCGGQQFAGVNANYAIGPNLATNLTAGCNSNCSCEANKFLFQPLCGADGLTYYSPCYAGCGANETVVAGVKYYANCACIAGRMQAGGANFSAVAGACKDAGCNYAGALLALIGLFLFCVFFISVPSLQCTMRVIPPLLKDFGIGIQWVILRCLGSIPGPLLFGTLIDTTCILWTGGCGSIGNCSFYDSHSFWVVIIVFAFVLKGLETLFMLLATVLYKPPPTTEEDKQQQQKQQIEMPADSTAQPASYENKGFE